jgi:(S)-ureidoglycine aminohydrolase
MNKWLGVIFFILVSLKIYSQNSSQLTSNVNSWSASSLRSTKYGQSRLLFEGSGKILNHHSMVGHIINGRKQVVFHEKENGKELFFIVKSGPVEVRLNNTVKQLDKGSVVFLLPGDEVCFKNTGRDQVQIYEMQMQSSSPDQQRGQTAGNSFMMDWYDMEYRAHERGGVRQLFDRKTVMTNRFDIHITSLNPGISSHPPHTHVNEEIILMIDGEGEMILGEKKQRITTGDAAWVESMIPHNITNVAKRPAVYFAIQWN